MYAARVSFGEPGFDPVQAIEDFAASGRIDEALELCRAQLAQGRDSRRLRLTFARCLVSAGHALDAAATLQDAQLLWPQDGEIMEYLGDVFAGAGRVPDAISALQRAGRLQPGHGEIHLKLSRLWLEAGEPDKATEEVERAFSLQAITATERDKIRGDAQILRDAARASPGYVRQLFNQFAASYDQRMRGQLGYAAPEILFQLTRLLIDPQRRFRIVDLGCGTGLSGVAYKPIAAKLVGVDLSEGMLEHARALGIYDDLLLGDVETLPNDLQGQFDIALAADVAVYLGDLAPLFENVRTCLSADGLWVFTTEQGERADFTLGEKRRYRHSSEYLRALAEQFQFQVCSLVECVCRHEKGVPVMSWAAAMRRLSA